MLALDPFYPILPDAEHLARLVPLGIRLVQLRMKDAPPHRVRDEIARSMEICAQHDCQLVVNDYWREAIALGADFIHLGQEDLEAADLPAIKEAGLKLGISTHSQAELAVAIDADPDYIALGPVYETKLKKMAFGPQGLDRVTEWRRAIPCPLVAIGGITPDRAPLVLAAGADSVAVITDLLGHAAPETRLLEWLAVIAPLRRKTKSQPS